MAKLTGKGQQKMKFHIFVPLTLPCKTICTQSLITSIRYLLHRMFNSVRFVLPLFVTITCIFLFIIRILLKQSKTAGFYSKYVPNQSFVCLVLKQVSDNHSVKYIISKYMWLLLQPKLPEKSLLKNWTMLYEYCYKIWGFAWWKSVSSRFAVTPCVISTIAKLRYRFWKEPNRTTRISTVAKWEIWFRENHGDFTGSSLRFD